ncbi:hypothetical protein C8F04DRAFT_1195643 [Mycena alexandri]|uniref:Uncharacterized protein n=1 Tax=Mycena alexandri TaxID=1745969 RepID=A0AAD6WRW8_9AGAR|nr:hypothetical protein C8F04DRAFT_1195643 [Mycena alexandri]
MFIVYSANNLGLAVAGVLTAIAGVILVTITGGIAAAAIVPAIAAIANGIGTGITVGVGLAELGLAFYPHHTLAADSMHRRLGAAAVAAQTAGMHSVGPGGTYRSGKLSLSLIHQANVQAYRVVDNVTLLVWSGSFTVFTGPTAGSTKTYKLSDQLPKLDNKQVVFHDATTMGLNNPADDLFSNFSFVQYTAEFNPDHLGLKASCAALD